MKKINLTSLHFAWLAAVLITTVMLLPLNAHAVTFKIATVAPDGTTWMKEIRAGAEEIERRTEGRVKFKIFPGGIMGNDTSVLRKIRVGQLHGGAFAGSSLLEIYPDAQLYSLPLQFRSYEEVDYVRARMDAEIKQGMEAAGLVPLGLTEGGFAYLMSQNEVDEMEDLAELKIWVPEGDPVSVASFKQAGVSPIPLPFPDVYTGLQTGLIDSVVTVPTAAIAFQWHTRLKTYTDVPLSYVTGTLVVTTKAFKKLSDADQLIVREIMTESFDRLSALNRADNENARQALQTQGMTFVDMSDEETALWRERVDQAINKLDDGKMYTPALLERMRGLLQEYRASNAATAAAP